MFRGTDNTQLEEQALSVKNNGIIIHYIIILKLYLQLFFLII
jgi:hypothetical protein